MLDSSALPRFGASVAMALALATSADAADAIKVGVVTPLSGAYAPIGAQVRWGAELAVKEITAAGGVKGRPFELLFEDEEANPAGRGAQVGEALQQDKVDLADRTVNSGRRLRSATRRAQRPILITTGVLRPDHHRRAVQPECVPRERQRLHAVEQLTAWLTKNVSGKRYFFIGPDYEMGRSTIGAFQDDIKRLGGSDVGATFPPLGAKDFTIYRPDPRRASRRDHDRDRRQRHRAPAHPAQGVRHSLGQADLAAPPALSRRRISAPRAARATAS
jgi:branched-chain amino acid transport system substrate-binding protein